MPVHHQHSLPGGTSAHVCNGAGRKICQGSDQYDAHLRFSKATRGGDFDFPTGDDERKAIKMMLFGAASPMRPIQKETENNKVGCPEKLAYTMRSL